MAAMPRRKLKAVLTAVHRAVVAVQAPGLGVALTGAVAVGAVGKRARDSPRAMLPGDFIRLR